MKLRLALAFLVGACVGWIAYALAEDPDPDALPHYRRAW